MHSVRVDYPTDWPHANVYTLADLHIGDPHCDMAEVTKRVKQIEEDPYGLVVLNGDLMNTALKTSVSDVYSEVLSPMQQITYLVNLLRPIAGKVIGATAGNHENRVFQNDGLDTMRLVCRELGVEDKYAPEGVLIFLRFGKRNGHAHHADRHPRQWYSIYAMHGSGGGGRKEGGKATRLADMNSIVDADIFIHSHVHLGMIMKERYYRIDNSNCVAKPVDKLFVCTGASLKYGGYGQAKGFKPASQATPVIHLEAKTKHMTATM